MSQDTQHKTPDICPVAAQRIETAPGRDVRNKLFTELGSLKLDEGTVRVFAKKTDGSIMVVMPDRSGYLLDTNLVATQCYKYWKLHPGQQPIASDEVDKIMPLAEGGDAKILNIDGQPIQF